MKQMKYLLLALALFLVGVLGVNAETDSTTADLSKMRLVVENVEDGHDRSNAFIGIYDANLIEDYEYAAILTKTNEEMPETVSTLDTDYELNYLGLIKDSDGNIIENAHSISSIDYISVAEKWGDVYVTFYESEAGGTYSKISEPILV